ncbi:MAG: VCBS repeat-containing protein [bacterium]
MNRSRGRLLHLALVGLSVVACHRVDNPATLFERLAPSATGVTFENRLPEDSSVNILNFLSYYNGGGVAAGDVNGDGLPDLYFTSNLGPNRLYLNRGGYRFEDVTDRAGVAGPSGWKTGVTLADVNGDGRLDIYVSTVSYGATTGRNALYVNNGDGTFTERARQYGIDRQGASTQAAFFDYDGDGDLDLFVLSYSTHAALASAAPRRDVRSATGGGRLYRNDGGHFVDVSAHAGIYGGTDGFGLGLVVSDLNQDGCPDVYVANDFQEHDFLYLNNCDGTFTESIARATGHTSRFSMGVDAADVNNDGRPDLIVADMLPERESILKSSASTEGIDLFTLRSRAGYHPQYERNTLQLNRGQGHFSDIGFLAGVHATDWSWAPLFADLDNDGRKDLFVTSGIYRRPNDLDYIAFVNEPAVQATLTDTITTRNLALLKHMPQVPVPNHAFRNEGGLRFTDSTSTWGLGQPGFSNGAVYVDLNNSGALDLVVNGVNAPAAIYRNHARERNGNGSLTVVLHGSGGNTQGIGAKLFARAGGTTQLLEQQTTRGFQSSVDTRLHVGLGRAPSVESLTVVWPDRRFQVLTNVPANTLLTLSQANANGRYELHPSTPPALFQDVTQQRHVNVRHVENAYNEFDREPLMPRLLSTEGPALASGDVNGDGLDDLFVGGAMWQPPTLLVQQRDGSFKPSPQPGLAADSTAEDVDAAFFDADGDGSLDLYVVSGGNAFAIPAAPMRGRLYHNDGHGQFTRVMDAIPELYDNGGCVAAGDFDGDGHIDLFLGSRSVPGKYGISPRSHLLRNDGTGHFTDVTRDVAPGLATPGMITAASWVDYDGDGHLDLVVVGEWTPVRVFHQENGQLVERTVQAGLGGTEGWWNTVSTADVNADGRPDLVLGNLGLNAYVTASRTEPAHLYVNDFAHDGTSASILTSFRHGVSYPVAGRDELTKVIPALRARFPTYASFGASTVTDIVSPPDLQGATILQAHTFASAIALNNGRGGFALQPLPIEAQLAPVSAVVTGDFDDDGRIDLLLAGNFFAVPPMQGRYDASYGLLLHGSGDGHFVPVDMSRSGVQLEGQVRRMRVVRTADTPLVAVARNDDRLMLLKPSHPTKPESLASVPRRRAARTGDR